MKNPRNFRTHDDIDRALKWANHTGLCVVCEDVPRKELSPGNYTMTCGNISCMNLWLRGQKDPCIGLTPYGLREYKGVLVVYVCYKTGELYSFTPANALAAIETGRHKKRPAYQYVNGRKTKTAGGYTVPPSMIGGCEMIEIPHSVMDSYQIIDSMSTSAKGRAAEGIVRECITMIPQLIPRVEFVDDIELQTQGNDFIWIPSANMGIEVKCDLPGGSRSRGGTGNLFLQVCESNPNKSH